MTPPVAEKPLTLRQRIAARTPEEADRRRFGLWVAGALIVLLPLWWVWGADLAVMVLKPVAAIVVGLFGLSGGIAATPDGGWAVSTDLPLADGSGALLYSLSPETLRRLMMGVPLFAAFMIAPPRADRPVRVALIGAAVLIVLFLLSVTAVLWGEIAPMLNPALAPSGKASQSLAGAPLNPVLAQIAVIGRYIALSVAPLIVSIILWAVLNPRGREALLGSIAEEG